MKPWLQGIAALIMVVIFIGLLIGSLSLTFAETGIPTDTVIVTVILDSDPSAYGTAIPQLTKAGSDSAAHTPERNAAASPTGSNSTAQNPIEDCYAPASWVSYVVQPEDTLQSLSIRVNADITQLQFANCLGDSTEIKVGQELLVPRPPESTATPTPLPPSPTPTETAAPTPDLPLPTSAFFPSSTPTPSFEIIIVQ